MDSTKESLRVVVSFVLLLETINDQMHKAKQATNKAEKTAVTINVALRDQSEVDTYVIIVIKNVIADDKKNDQVFPKFFFSESQRPPS